MGGKTATTTQSVQIPKDVLERYNAVNTRAENVASRPFQQYGTTAEAFVAPINQQQMAGIGNINEAAGLAQPYYGMAGGMTMAGAGAVNPQQYSAGAVQGYMNPYISNVADTTAAQMKNLFGQQAEELKGGAIRSGAFGGDRAGIAQGNLANQQGLSFGQNMANIYGQGFTQAQQQFNQQQGVNLQAQQANQARLLAAAQQYGGLGAGAQAAALQGAQAQLGAGTLQQQTEQAGLTALYNQFQQQQAYPFQVAQFLANIAMGTGALSGSTTTTTQPAPFFSDERMKDNIETIGKTFDGQNIVKFNYKGDKQKQIGLVAQDVEKHHPEAVGSANGMKTVDYDGATKEAARRGKAMGGLSSEGGAVMPQHAGLGFAVGGGVNDPYDPYSIQNILNRSNAMYANMPHPGVYGRGEFSGLPHGAKSHVPQGNLPVRELLKAGPAPELPQSGFEQGMSAIDRAQKIAGMFDTSDPSSLAGLAKRASGAKLNDDRKTFDYDDDPSTPKAHGGALSYAVGGTLPYGDGNYEDSKLDIPDDKSALRLPTAGTPQQQGSGLGDLATMVSLGKTILTGIPFFANGGRAGYATQGSVYDPTMGKTVSTEMSPVEELNKPDVYSKGLHPAVAPRFRTFERLAREKGADITPNETYRSPERSAFLDLTMPEGAPRAKPYTSGHNYGLATDFSGIKPENYDAIRQAAKETGLTAGVDFKNPDPPHIQAGLGSYGSHAGKDVSEVNVDEGFLNRSQKGLVPPEMQEEAYRKGRILAANTPEGRAKEAKGEASSSGFGMNQETIVPLLTGLGAMLSSRSPYLASAIGEGLVAGGQSYMGTQKAAADIAQTKAATEQTESVTAANYQDIARNAVWKLGDETYAVGLNPDGTWGIMNEKKARQLLKEGKLKTDPRSGKIIFEERQPTEPPEGAVKIGEGGPQAGLSPQGAGTEKPVPTGLSPDTQGANVFALNDNDRKFIAAEAERELTGSPTKIKEANELTSKKMFDNVYQIGDLADNSIRRILDYAGELSVRPETGLFAPGSLGESAKSIGAAVQDIASRFGLKTPFDPGVLGNEEAMKKQIRQLSKEAYEGGNYGAQRALDQLEEMFPSSNTTKDGAATNSAKLLISFMKNKDMRGLASEWQKVAEENSGTAPQMAVYSGKNFQNWFNKKYDGIYTQDEQALKKMFMENPTGDNNTQIRDQQTGEPISWIRYIYKYGNNSEMFPTQESREAFRDAVAAKFGKNVIRYFPMLEQYKGQ